MLESIRRCTICDLNDDIMRSVLFHLECHDLVQLRRVSMTFTIWSDCVLRSRKKTLNTRFIRSDNIRETTKFYSRVKKLEIYQESRTKDFQTFIASLSNLVAVDALKVRRELHLTDISSITLRFQNLKKLSLVAVGKCHNVVLGQLLKSLPLLESFKLTAEKKIGGCCDFLQQLGSNVATIKLAFSFKFDWKKISLNGKGTKVTKCHLIDSKASKVGVQDLISFIVQEMPNVTNLRLNTLRSEDTRELKRLSNLSQLSKGANVMGNVDCNYSELHQVKKLFLTCIHISPAFIKTVVNLFPTLEVLNLCGDIYNLGQFAATLSNHTSYIRQLKLMLITIKHMDGHLVPFFGNLFKTLSCVPTLVVTLDCNVEKQEAIEFLYDSFRLTRECGNKNRCHILVGNKPRLHPFSKKHEEVREPYALLNVSLTTVVDLKKEVKRFVNMY